MSLHTLMFGWEYPPLHLGGLGVACQGLVKGLLKNGVQVTLALPHANSNEDGVEMRFPTKAILDSVKVSSLITPYDSHKTYAQRIQKVPEDMREIYGSGTSYRVLHSIECRDDERYQCRCYSCTRLDDLRSRHQSR